MPVKTRPKQLGRTLQRLLRARSETIKPSAYAEKFELMNMRTFLGESFRQEWLIEELMVDRQPMIVGGPKKALKTSIVIDLAVSLAAAKPFLGRFTVRKAIPVGIMSGESGGATIQATLRRVCESKEIEHPENLPIFCGLDVPSLSSPQDLKGIAAAIKNKRLKVLVIDPLYLALLKGNPGLQATNLYDIGPLLSDIAKTCLDAGATPVIVHHFRKSNGFGGRENANQPPELDDLAFAGISEFARQWMLIGRRRRFDPESGRQELWLSVGGSAGHSDVWSVDVDEGRMRRDFRGRHWRVEVRSQREQIELDLQRNETQRRDRAEHEDNSAMERIRHVLQQYPNGVSVNRLSPLVQIGKPRLESLIDRLVQAREVTRVDVEGLRGNGRRRSPGVRYNFPTSDSAAEAGSELQALQNTCSSAPARVVETTTNEQAGDDADDTDE